MESLSETPVTLNSSFPWGIEQHGGRVHIDDYANFPTETIASIDLETNGKEITDNDFKIVCVGICGNGRDAYIYFDLRPQLFDYLRSVHFVAQDGKRAEIPWLASHNVTIDQLYFDTKIGFYVYDSSRKNYSLKPLVKDLFNVEYPSYDEMISNQEMVKAVCDQNPEWMVQRKKGLVYPEGLTLDKMPKEFVAAYNACDVFWQFRLWKWLEANFSVAQKNFFETIEMPMTRLLYHTEKQGIKIDTNFCLKEHKKQLKKAHLAKKEFKHLAGL